MFRDTFLPLRRDLLRCHLALLLLFLLIAPLPAACSTISPQTPVATPADPTQTPAALVPAPTVALAPASAAYPDITNEGIAAPTNAAYPAQPSPAPTVNPYPGGLIWIIRPVGVQCEAERPIGYGSLNEAVAILFAAGVSVQASETIELGVTTACGSPTSEHYRVQIGADHLPAVEGIGWVVE